MARLGLDDAQVRRDRQLDGIAPADFSEALARGVAVLRAFGEGERLTLADLARRLGLPRATVRRAVVTLVHLGYVAAEGRTFALTPRVLELAATFLRANPVSTILQPACERVAAELGEACAAAVLDGGDAVMIARAVPHQLLAVGHGVGYRVPALHSALGRVLLANLPESALDARLAAVPEPERIRAAVASAGARGWAYVAHEVEPGFHSVAVPVRRWDGSVIAALNIGCGVSRRDRESMLGEVLDRLRSTTDELREQLI
ncbi:IclR family transcriptional regulator [Pseudonocardia yuanmonensis]|uniref:IclR family transcriptional regulator n=1 Tax=Pseudonocardia yuanmonensis TaxID=1095914 RepID=A0ABP8W2W1_9PSEU